MEVLPVEIVHRIFDNLDIKTIFFSLRPLCRYFRSVVQNYDRLDFHLKIISKFDFDILCHLVSPKNIRSLTLYHNAEIPDQISLFLSRIRLRQLTKLHSIHLHGIEEFQLNYLFKRINLNLLRSLSIDLTKHDNRRRKTTTNSLSIIVQQSNLRTIEFNMKNIRISQIEWPSNCSIECLILNGDINFENLIKICSCSPHLHRLIIKENFSYLINSHQLTSSFPQLTSLIVEHVDVTIDQIESFLLLTPSLDYLKLVGHCEIFQGKRWEDFIQGNLSHLNRFQFDIISRKSSAQTRENLNLCIQSYRSSFWIEYKNWFIIVELNLKDPYSYRISSIPICQYSYEYPLDLKKIFCSTSNEICPMEKICQLNLRFKLVLEEKIFSSMNSSFPNVRKLHFYFNGNLPVYYETYLRQMFDVFSQLIEVKFENEYFHEGDEDFIYKLFKLLRKSPQLSSFILHIRSDQYDIYPHLETIMELLPYQIKHLQIPIQEAKQIEILINRCQHLAIVRFPIRRIRRSLEIQKWFKRNTSASIYSKSDGCDVIWIGKKNKVEQNFNYKRIKINELFMET